jgi:hypothetical protein
VASKHVLLILKLHDKQANKLGDKLAETVDEIFKSG